MRHAVWIAGLIACAGMMAGAASVQAQTRAFNVPAGDINKALPLLAKQGGVQIIVNADQLGNALSPDVIGSFEVRAAIQRLISLTNLEIAKAHGAIVVLRPRRVKKLKRPARTRPAPVARPQQPHMDIIVTGSRIARETLSQARAVTRITRLQLDLSASASLETSFNQLPQFTPGQTAFATHFAATGLSTLNMRGLGAQRNLILLDGRRLQPSTSAVEIDINTIPSMLVESADLVTGGASAVYGSDAMSGVINFRLKTSMTGIQIKGQSSLTQRGDGRDTDLQFALGTDFAGQHGHAVLALSYNDRQAVPRQARSFYRQSYAVGGGSASGTLPLGTFSPNPANLPSQDALNALFARYGSTDTIPVTSMLGFNPDGSLFTQNGTVRNYRGPGAADGYGINAVGSLVYDPNTEDGLMAPMKRLGLFTHLTYDLSDRLTLYARGYATFYRNTSLASASLAIGNNRLRIPVTNPFIPEDLKTVLASRPDPLADFFVVKRFSANGGRTIEHDFDVFQMLAGATGKLSDGTKWDVYVSHGQTRTIDRLVNSNMIGNRLRQLLGAPDGGAALCAGGFNPFLDQPLSQDCIDFTSREVVSHTRLRQTVLEASIQGDLLDMSTGPLSIAAGLGYRGNSYVYAPDPILYPDPTDLLAFLSSAPTSGTTSVREVYGELLIPLLRDTPLARALDLNLAARYSDYDIAGGMTAYKAEASWTILPGLTLRGGYQRAVRAPNVGELFSGTVGTTNALGSPAIGGGDPCDVRTAYRRGVNAEAIRTICLAQGVPANLIDSYTMEFNQFFSSRAGSADVDPEKANTFTLGAAFVAREASPWLRRLSLSVDYYKIDIANAIGSVAAAQALTNCFTSANNPGLSPDNDYCLAIARNADGTIRRVDTPYRNLSAYRIDGIDMQLDWMLPFEALGAAPEAGGLSINILVNHLRSYRMQASPDQPFLHFAGVIGGTAQVQPRWRSTSTFAYVANRFTIATRWRHLSAMDDVTRETTPANERPGVPAYDVFDLFCRLRITPQFDLRVGIDNLADRAPPIVGGLAGFTDLGTYDGLGRRFYLGFRAKL